MYPYNNPVSDILRDFNFGRAVALILSISHILLTCYQFLEPAEGTRFWTYVHLISSALVFVILYHVMFATVPTQRLKDAFTAKAHYEAALYGSLAAANEQPETVRAELFESYLKHLRANGADHEIHLRNLPPMVEKSVYEICHGLIKKEKADLAQKLQKDIGGSSIENHGNDISRLEAIANCVRPMPKISAFNTPYLFPDATGEMAEVK